MGWFSDALKGVAGDALGGLIGGGINSAYAQQNAEQNMGLQKELWKYMQSNKHQLEVQDLEAAGLNKILSATNGQAIGAPSVSGSADTSNTVNSAVAAKRQYEVAKINAETEKVKAEADKTNAQANADNAATNKAKADQDILESKARIPVYEGQSAKLIAERDAVRQGILNDIRRLEQDIKESDSRISFNNAQTYNLYKLTPYQVNRLDMEAQELLSRMGLTEKEIALKKRELENVEPEKRKAFLESWLGDKLHYLGYVGEDISKIIGGINFTFGRYKRSD